MLSLASSNSYQSNRQCIQESQQFGGKHYLLRYPHFGDDLVRGIVKAYRPKSGHNHQVSDFRDKCDESIINAIKNLTGFDHINNHITHFFLHRLPTF